MATLVIGAGIVGSAIALELRRRGVDTTLVEADEPGMGASFGNVASIAVTEFMPASRPSVWRHIPGWLMDPEGPVCIRPSYFPKALPWLIRFAAAGLPKRMRALEAAGAALCARVHEDLAVLLKASGQQDMLTDTGCLCLFANDAELRADREHLEALDRHGVPYKHLTGDELRALEPAISPNIARAVLFAENRSVKSPHKLVMGYVNAFEKLGGKREKGKVVAFTREGRKVTGVQLEDGRQLMADQTIVACGARSHQLSKLLGDIMPLETERGYHTQIMAPGISLSHSIIWPAKAFMVTPTAGGLRVGGTVELAGLEAAPNYRRSEITVKRAKEALPGLQDRDSKQWMGHRPSFPDTIPVIGASPNMQGVLYATGHGHLGLTLSATTARLIADLATGQKPPLDITPFRVNRF
ncbi:MAG: FAD-binding oxidoreductase [Alphaproteobacteria bacterium]|nr:FAD-binding oxidoreductase [Alphaproteobacteria bacterium]